MEHLHVVVVGAFGNRFLLKEFLCKLLLRKKKKQIDQGVDLIALRFSNYNHNH